MSRWRLGRVLRDRGGTALVEGAFAMVILAFIILGSVEVARYVLLNQKLDRVAVTLADLVSQGETISASEVQNLMSAAEFVMSPFTLGNDGIVIVSSVSKSEDNPIRVNWQQTGAGSFIADSDIGEPGDTASLPDGLEVRAGESMITAEVYYRFTPMFFTVAMSETVLYRRAFFRPRLGFLTELED